MSLIQTEYATGQMSAPSPGCAGETVSYRAEIDFTAAQLTLGQIVEMGPLPAGCDLVDAILDADGLDSNGAPAITLDVGIMSGTFGDPDPTNSRTCGNEVFAASNVAQAGGVARPSLATAFRVARSSTDRGVGLKVSAAPATAQAGKVGVTLIYRG